MSISADCREKYSKQAYPFGTQFQKNEDIPEDEINPYWEGRLKGKKKAFIDGYDACVEDTIGSYFSNLSTSDNFLEYLGFSTLSKIDDDVLADERSADEFPDEEKASWSQETLMLKLIKDGLLETAENCRNDMVTTFLEDDASPEEE